MANISVKESRNQKRLKDVPFESGFHFCTDGGHYTGISAVSLCDFMEKLKTIHEDSIDFHLKRRDFQKWARDVFGDEELAWEFDRVSDSGGDMRQQLIDIVNSHVNYLVSVS
ncbi:MAG: hypothetical protein ACQCN6_15005 [Candidatus Bathyarchaeia archaeon]